MSIVARLWSNPEQEHWTVVKRILSHLKGIIPLGLTFSGFEENWYRSFVVTVMRIELKIRIRGDRQQGVSFSLVTYWRVVKSNYNRHLHPALPKLKICHLLQRFKKHCGWGKIIVMHALDSELKIRIRGDRQQDVSFSLVTYWRVVKSNYNRHLHPALPKLKVKICHLLQRFKKHCGWGKIGSVELNFKLARNPTFEDNQACIEMSQYE